MNILLKQTLTELFGKGKASAVHEAQSTKLGTLFLNTPRKDSDGSEAKYFTS